MITAGQFNFIGLTDGQFAQTSQKTQSGRYQGQWGADNGNVNGDLTAAEAVGGNDNDRVIGVKIGVGIAHCADDDASSTVCGNIYRQAGR